ncbi:MAG: BamA/TamA family outer membrane protein, partial [Candidatus Zixiibacteriota bacterium]
LIDIPGGDSAVYRSGQKEPPSFDSIPPPTPGGEYQIKKYKVKLTPDYIGGGFAYDTYFGLRGQSYFVFSDYLGNHQIFIATDLVNTIDQSFVQAYYFYNRRRTNIGAGLFHTKNFYIDNRDFLFSDRFYGAQIFVSRPFSVFSRIDLFASQYFIDREYLDQFDPLQDRSSKVTTGELAWVTDNIIWGITGPVNGRRTRLAVSGGINLFDAGDIEFTAVDLDFRKYWHFRKAFSVAFRLAGGASFGKTPKLYLVGGTTNWIGNRTIDAKVFEVENLYFADVVTPLRAVDYYELTGARYGLVNWEFRFPMIEYFAMRFPLPLVIRNVTGALFTDVGAAWTGNEFKGGTTEGGRNRLQDIKTGFGIGMRANLGFVVLRYDLAWSTDFYSVSEKSTSYFSFGADF